MQKGVLAGVAITAAFGCAAPAYAADADVYARDSISPFTACFSSDAAATECAGGETATVSIAPGEMVTWHFDGAEMDHNAQDADGTSPAWQVPPTGLTHTGSYSHTFPDAGVYHFVCAAHPQMTGTVTVGTPDPPDDPPDDDPPSSPPPTTHPTTPPPTPSADSVKPTVKSVKLKALRRAVRVRFRLSEPASVTVRVKRGRKVIKSKRVQAGAGTHSLTVRSKKLKKGRYTVEILARDASGNRSRLATKRLSLRT